MNKFQELLVAGLIAAVATGVVAGVVIWKITATQHDFVAEQFAAQTWKIQTVSDELTKTAGDLKRLDGALKTTEATLREVKDQVSLVGTRNGIAQLNTLVEAARKTLAEIKQATSPEQVKAGLAPLVDKLDDKTRDQTLARIETVLAGVKDAIAKQPVNPALTQINAKLDEALKSLAAISKTANTAKGDGTDTARLDETTKSLAAIQRVARSGQDRHRRQRN